MLGIGPILSEALDANIILKKEGIQLGIASMGSVKPLDHKFLQQCVEDGYTQWISLEEHHQGGGLGTALLEWLSEEEIKNIALKRIGVADHFVHQLGTQTYVREAEGLNANFITNTVRAL